MKTYITPSNVAGIETDLEIKGKHLILDEMRILPKMENMLEFNNAQQIRINVDYLKEIIKQFPKDEHITIMIKNDMPMVIKSKSIRGVIAPIVGEE